MYRSFALSLMPMLCVAHSLSAQDEARLLRFPATHGDQVVFTYAGDLYSVPANGGTARKLTSHVGFEMFARFSPDGKSIAFTGQYDGNTEVYLILAEGGVPKPRSCWSGKRRSRTELQVRPSRIKKRPAGSLPPSKPLTGPAPPRRSVCAPAALSL